VLVGILSLAFGLAFLVATIGANYTTFDNPVPHAFIVVMRLMIGCNAVAYTAIGILLLMSRIPKKLVTVLDRDLVE
jgi:hypothetical protein